MTVRTHTHLWGPFKTRHSMHLRVRTANVFPTQSRSLVVMPNWNNLSSMKNHGTMLCHSVSLTVFGSYGFVTSPMPLQRTLECISLFFASSSAIWTHFLTRPCIVGCNTFSKTGERISENEEKKLLLRFFANLCRRWMRQEQNTLELQDLHLVKRSWSTVLKRSQQPRRNVEVPNCAQAGELEIFKRFGVSDQVPGGVVS